MQQWVNKDKTLICLVATDIDSIDNSYPCHDSAFYDSDLGFVTAIAYRPMTVENGNKHFGHLRLA